MWYVDIELNIIFDYSQMEMSVWLSRSVKRLVVRYEIRWLKKITNEIFHMVVYGSNS